MHAISSTWDDVIPTDASVLDMMAGGFRSYACLCGQALTDYAAAQLHAIETAQCSVCLGRTRVSLAPGTEHGCGYCGGAGTRDAELAEQLARGAVEAAVDQHAFAQAVASFQGREFTKTEIHERLAGLVPEATTPQLAGRVGQLMRLFQRKGLIMQVSAPTGVDSNIVFYDNPRWQATTSSAEQ
ncbi:hypothetical protein [Nonomuraea sp. KM90]|uniref:hypothetical protein n=1 Tax=Nonomuraea sp. KM90 TaxID=3457428 RepID=UPI003FCE4130